MGNVVHCWCAYGTEHLPERFGAPWSVQTCSCWSRTLWVRGRSRWGGNKQVVELNNFDDVWIYRIKKIGRSPCLHDSRPTSPLFMITTHHDTSCYNNAPMIHAFLLFPCIHSFMFHICMSFSPFFGLHGSPIQPLWLWSILIGCSTCLVFSKKRPYWMVLMPVYMEMAEGLVKPLVILPATVMPLPPFILIFSRHHHPLCSSWFIPFSQPTSSLFHLTNRSHTPYRLCPPIVPIILLCSETFSPHGRTM